MENISSVVMLVALVVVFYFMLIRPENKRKKKTQQMRESLKKGDTITTIGGIIGRVVKTNENTLVIETSEDRVRLEVTRWAVSNIGVQTTDQPDNSKNTTADEVPEEPVDEIPESEEK